MTLLYEETGDLSEPTGVAVVAAHAPKRCVRAGAKDLVSNAPTFYGTVGFDTECARDRDEIEVDGVSPVCTAAAKEPAYPRCGIRKGKAIRSATMNGAPVRHEGEWALLPPLAVRGSLIVKY